MPTTQAHEFAAGVRTDGVRNATGRDWQAWFTLLDQAGAGVFSRQEITRYLQNQMGLSSWWSRIVTAGYEQVQGKRPERVHPVSYTATRSRTVHVPVARLYRAWAVEALRARWLPGYPLLIRKAVPDRSMRINWPDNISGLNVFFIDRGLAESQVRVHHVHLPDSGRAEEMKSFWSGALSRLRGLLEDDESVSNL